MSSIWTKNVMAEFSKILLISWAISAFSYISPFRYTNCSSSDSICTIVASPLLEAETELARNSINYSGFVESIFCKLSHCCNSVGNGSNWVSDFSLSVSTRTYKSSISLYFSTSTFNFEYSSSYYSTLFSFLGISCRLDISAHTSR